mmetsp:Transcript_25254/g.61278  ORF Transcript_25254/g.61278 Transcript_25254/m.61278 type:complete len:254 (-) Transcript_25254:708-1469(-)
MPRPTAKTLQCREAARGSREARWEGRECSEMAFWGSCLRKAGVAPMQEFKTGGLLMRCVRPRWIWEMLQTRGSDGHYMKLAEGCPRLQAYLQSPDKGGEGKGWLVLCEGQSHHRLRLVQGYKEPQRYAYARGLVYVDHVVLGEDFERLHPGRQRNEKLLSQKEFTALFPGRKRDRSKERDAPYQLVIPETPAARLLFKPAVRLDPSEGAFAPNRANRGCGFWAVQNQASAELIWRATRRALRKRFGSPPTSAQ